MGPPEYIALGSAVIAIVLAIGGMVYKLGQASKAAEGRSATLKESIAGLDSKVEALTDAIALLDAEMKQHIRDHMLAFREGRGSGVSGDGDGDS